MTRRAASAIARTMACSLAGLGGLSSGAAVCASLAGVRLNVSPSVPLGLYRETPAPVARGAMVVACLPMGWGDLAKARGYLGVGRCPGGVSPVGKLVLAMPGDTVTFTMSGIVVNGQPISRTRPQPRDHAGRPLAHYPFGTMVVRAGTVVLYAPHGGSFDARYYGPIPTAGVQTVVRPIWTVADAQRVQRRAYSTMQGRAPRSPAAPPGPMRRR